MSETNGSAGQTERAGQVSVEDPPRPTGPRRTGGDPARQAGRAGRPRFGPRVLPAVLVGLVIVALLAALLVVVTRSGPGAGERPPPASVGVVENRAVPSSVLNLPLEDQRGQRVDLASFRGKTLLLAPFLTSCQEECPITTGALLQLHQELAAGGLGGRVVLIEASVDPGRDTPERLAAYQQYVGSTWPLLTGTPGNLATLWHFFGVYYEKVPEGSPPGIDWQTGRPYTYDVDHSEGFIVIDARQHERFVAGGMAQVHGQLQPDLHKMLDAHGVGNLDRPGAGSWTVAQAEQALKWAAAGH